MNYEKLLTEREITATIWDKESLIIIDENSEIDKDTIADKLSWIEENKSEIIEFALEAEDFLYGINEDISKTLAKKGKYELYDGTILENTIDEETLVNSIYVNSVYFDEYDFSIDLATSPDYFGGHLLDISVTLDDNEMEYNGMNG